MDKKNNDKAKPVEHKTKRNIWIYVGSIILLVFSTIAFVFTPAMGSFSKQDELPPLGYYDGEKIEYDENFYNMVEYYIEQMKYMGTQGDPTFSAMTQAFNDAVISVAFSREVEDSGYIVPETLVKRAMIPYFSDENGVYSDKIFQDTPEATKVAIKESTMEYATRNVFAKDISKVKSSSKEIEFINEMNKNQRSFNMVSFNTADYPTEEIVAYGLENAELFTQYDMDIITLNSEEEATALASRIKNNEITFIDAIAAHSINQYSQADGKLTDSFHYELKNIVKGEDDFTALTALEAGKVSDVIETTTGFSLFSVRSAAKSASFPNEELETAVKSYLSIYEAGVVEDYFINLAKDFASQSMTKGYNETVTEFGLTSVALDSFPINFGNIPLLGALPTANAPELASAQANEQFYEAAFALELGQISDPIVLGKSIVVLSLVEKTEAEENSSLEYMFPYYVSQFDSSDVSSFYMGSDKLENNLFSVLIEYFL